MGMITDRIKRRIKKIDNFLLYCARKEPFWGSIFYALVMVAVGTVAVKAVIILFTRAIYLVPLLLGIATGQLIRVTLRTYKQWKADGRPT